MNRCIIVHGWEGFPEEGWFPWLKHELETRGFSVAVPAMPNSAEPKLAEWLPHLVTSVGKPDEHTFLVGHSLGCITILRYLESLPQGTRLGGALLVAGFGERLTYDEIAHYFATPINWTAIREHCPRFAAIFSDNDPFVPLTNAELFQRELNAQVEVLHAHGHFSGPSDNCTELPEALNAVLKLAQV